MKKRLFSILLTGAICGTMLGGCGNSGANEPAATAAEEKDTTEDVADVTETDAVESASVGITDYEGSLAGTTLTIGTDVSFVPFCFPDENDVYTGFDIDLIAAVSEYLGFEYELSPMDFTALLASIQTSKIDLGTAGITMTEEREEVMDFADAYYDAGLQIFCSVDSDITGFDDLAGKKLALKEGTAAVAFIEENYPDASVTTFPTIDEAYLEVQRGAADATVFDSPNMLYYVNQNTNCGCHVVGELADACQYGILFPAGSEYTEYFNAALAELRANGTYDSIYNTWFGTDN